MISTLAICIIAGALIGGTIGGIAGNAYANSQGHTGEEAVIDIITGAVFGAAIGAAAGALAAPAVTAATGIAGVSVTSAGVSTIAISPSAFLFGREATSSGQIISLLREYFEKGKVLMTLKQLKSLIALCEQFDIEITAALNDFVGHGAWTGIPHIHVGKQRIHIGLTEAALEYIKKYLGIG